MGPKVEAACEFARRTGHHAVIGALDDIERMAVGTAGTSVRSGLNGIVEGAPDRTDSDSAIRENTL
jgi:carbamate kinase